MAQVYNEKDYSNYFKTELKYKGRKPFYFLRSDESNPIYNFMVKYENSKYMIQIWNKPFPTVEELKQYLNNCKPKKVKDMKPINQTYYYRPKFRKFNKNSYIIESSIQKFYENIPENSVKKCLLEYFSDRPYKISNLDKETKEIFKLICNRNKGISFKHIDKEEYKNCKDIIIEKKRNEIFNTTELLNDILVEKYFSGSIKVINEFTKKNSVFENLYKINVNKWKSERELIRQKDGNIWHFHHIRPKSLYGCDNDNNLVCVKLNEHMLLHAILVLIYPNSEYMNKAFLHMYFGNEKDFLEKFLSEEIKYIKIPNYLAFMLVYDAIDKKILISNDEINEKINEILVHYKNNFVNSIDVLKEFKRVFNIDEFENINIEYLENIISHINDIAPKYIKYDYVNNLKLKAYLNIIDNPF